MDSVALISFVLAEIDETSASFQAGKIMGTVLFGSLLLFGIFRFAISMRKPEVQPLGPLAMILIFAAWIISMVLGIVDPHPVVAGLGFMLCMLFVCCAFVLAIVGLVLYSKNRERYQLGRRSAISAIVICGLFFLGTLGGFIYGFSNSFEAADGNSDPASSSVDPDVKRYEELNFEFEMPGRPWFNINPDQINPIAALVAQKGGENIIFMIIAERGGDDLKLDSDGLAEIAINNAEAVLEGASGKITGKTQVAGIEFTKISVQGRTAGKTVHQRIYAGEKNGFYFQLFAGANQRPEKLDGTLEEMSKHFRLIDPEAICHNSGSPFTDTVSMPELGLTARLKGTHWVQWDAIRTDFPEADFGALHTAETLFGLVSFDLRGQQVSDEELAAAAVFVVWGQTKFPDELDEIEPFEFGGVKGIDMRMKHKINSVDNHDKIRVFQHEGRGWCLVFWTGEKEEAKFESLAEVMEKIEPGPASAPETEVKLTNKQKEVRASLFNRIGLNRYQIGDYAGSIDLFRTASEIIPDDVDFVLNISEALINLKNHQSALDHLQENLTRFSKNPRFIGELALQLEQNGEPENAIARYREAFELGFDNEDYLLNCVNLLISAEQLDEGLAIVELFEKKHPSDDTLRWKSHLLERLERTKESIELLAKRMEEKPFNGAVAYDLAQTYLYDDAPEKCLEICDLFASKNNETWDVVWLRGEANMALKKYRDAKGAYENALKKDPDNPDLKHSLARASAALGEGNNTLVKEAIDPVSIPSSLQLVIDEAASDPAGDAAGAEILSRIRMIANQTGKPRRETTYTKVKITGEKGIEDFKTIRTRFDPFSERVYVNRVEVQDPEGKVVAQGSVDDTYVMDNGDDGMATEDQVLHVPIPGLKIGSVLEIEISRQDLGIAKRIEFTSELFYSQYPIRIEALGVSGDVASLKFATQGDFKTIEEDEFRAWSAIPAAQIDFEPLQSPIDRFASAVWFSDARDTWESLGKNYIKDLGALLVETPVELKSASTRALGSTAVSEEETIRKLARFVRTELTYKALEFGPRGRIPVETARTLRNRYGDCKDHSLLLHHLLKAQGIESYLALVHSDAQVREDLPDLDQFNHMILWVPAFHGGKFIDCTDDYLDAGDLSPDGLGGQLALILDPAAPHTMVIPEPGEGSRTMKIKRVLSVENRDLHVEETAEFGFYAGSRLRGFFGVRDPKEQHTAFQQTFEIPGFRVSKLEISHLGEVDQPLIIRAEYTLSGTVKTGIAPGTEEIALPGTWEKLYLKPSFVPKRQTPFYLETPIQIDTELVWKDSARKWELPDPTAFEKGEDSEFGVWHQKIEEDGSRLRWTFKAPAGSYPASRYQEYFDLTDHAIALWERGIRINHQPVAETP